MANSLAHGLSQGCVATAKGSPDRWKQRSSARSVSTYATFYSNFRHIL